MQTQTMTAARFTGFIQTDGSFGWFWDTKDKTFRPRVSLTTGYKNNALLKQVIRPWLDGQGILSQYQEKTSPFGMRTCNLVIERQTQVQKVIDLIDNASKNYPTLLVDTKLADYLALKYALKRTKQKAQVSTKAQRDEIYSELVDLKIILAKNAKTQEDKDQERSKNEQKLNVTNTNGKGIAVYNELLDQANAKSEALIQQLEQTSENSENCSKELAEFIVGIMEGDGSFQIGFGPGRNVQPSFEFDPMFTLTDGFVLTRNHNLIDLMNQFFGNQTKSQLVGGGKQAERLYIKSRKVLKKLVNFTRNVKLVLTGRLKRFLVLEKLILNYDNVYTDKAFTLSIIDGIEQNFEVDTRSYSPDMCRSMVNAYFDAKSSKK